MVCNEYHPVAAGGPAVLGAARRLHRIDSLLRNGISAAPLLWICCAHPERCFKCCSELEEEAKQAKAEDLRERGERQREAAATETDPSERKRKLTRASRSEENADTDDNCAIFRDSQSESL
jgi:hypothetical protein